MAAMTYAPIMICDHGNGTVSYHADAAQAHAAKWHTPGSPVSARMATREEHQAAGWDVAGYPQSIACRPPVSPKAPPSRDRDGGAFCVHA